MTTNMTDRHVIVTGGTGALGTAVVTHLLSSGATCSVPCVDDRELASCPFKDDDRVRIAMGIDLTNERAVASFYRKHAGIGAGPLWASIHLAGGFAMSPVDETTGEAFLHQMTMNALSCFLCCREAVKAMGDIGSGGRGGRIVNVAARPALEPRNGGGMVAYTAAKAAVAAMTEALGQEVCGRGILVNAVVPSIIDTEANRAAMPKAEHDCWAKPAEIAETIGFLVSPMNTSTRGALVPVYARA